jgi:hypothetical protein
MARKKSKRSDELSSRAAVRDKFLDVLDDVDKGLLDQRERTDDIMDAWDAYNCILGPKQFYNGNSQIFVPIIADAVGARVTRFANQIFPVSQRNVEVTTENADIPHATIALLEHYIRRAKLRTQVIRPLIVNGDVEGQYSLYVGWKEVKRRVVRRESLPLIVDGVEQPDLGTVDDIVEEEIVEGEPDIEVIADNDLLVLPVTADSIDDALRQGGSVTIIRRWTKARIRQKIDDDEIVESEGEALIAAMRKVAETGHRDTAKNLAQAAGIKRNGQYTQVFETWTNLKLDGEYQLCRGYYGGDQVVLGLKRNPYWCDKCPVLSGAAEKVTGVFKGKSALSQGVLDLQIFANDTCNEGADTAHFSAMPIIFTDPEKNPNVGSMVLGLASVWMTSPNDTKFAQFPELWKDAFARIAECKAQIFQSLSVNPSMLPQSTGGKAKRNQAELATEQQVDILTTADAVTNIEEVILTPLVERILEYDHQFRDQPLMVKLFGQMGRKANMQMVEPIQLNRRHEFRWFGVEAARNVAQVQQQIGMANVLKEVPPPLYQGYRLDFAPLMTQLVENTFGPRLAPLTFVSIADDITVDPNEENLMLEHGFDLLTHPSDNDPQHMQAHMQLLQMGDPHGTVRVHLQRHQQQMQMKAQAAAQQQQQGPPGASPGGPGGPPPGASPAGPHAVKGPPGQIHQDRLPAAGVVQMPRRM